MDLIICMHAKICNFCVFNKLNKIVKTDNCDSQRSVNQHDVSDNKITQHAQNISTRYNFFIRKIRNHKSGCNWTQFLQIVFCMQNFNKYTNHDLLLISSVMNELVCSVWQANVIHFIELTIRQVFLTIDFI